MVQRPAPGQRPGADRRTPAKTRSVWRPLGAHPSEGYPTLRFRRGKRGWENSTLTLQETRDAIRPREVRQEARITVPVRGGRSRRAVPSSRGSGGGGARAAMSGGGWEDANGAAEAGWTSEGEAVPWG